MRRAIKTEEGRIVLAHIIQWTMHPAQVTKTSRGSILTIWSTNRHAIVLRGKHAEEVFADLEAWGDSTDQQSGEII